MQQYTTLRVLPVAIVVIHVVNASKSKAVLRGNIGHDFSCLLFLKKKKEIPKKNKQVYEKHEKGK